MTHQLALAAAGATWSWCPRGRRKDSAGTITPMPAALQGAGIYPWRVMIGRLGHPPDDVRRARGGAMRQDGALPTHVALLRGTNVGGPNNMPMAELRQVVASLGHTEVATYIQSGNVVFSAAQADTADSVGTAALAEALEQAIA